MAARGEGGFSTSEFAPPHFALPTVNWGPPPADAGGGVGSAVAAIGSPGRLGGTGDYSFAGYFVSG